MTIEFASAFAAADTETGSRRDEDLHALFDRLAEGSAARDRDRILPFPEIAQLKALRFGAYRLPAGQGGTGASFRQLFAKIIRLGAADSNIAHILRNHFVFVERFARGRSDQARFWREKVAEGAVFGLANADKPGVPEAVTRLSADGDGYRLSGEKFYSTGTLYADYVIVRAKLPDEGSASVIIPTDRAGVFRDDDWDAAGQRLTGSGSTRFENVRISADEVVPDGETGPYDQAYKSTLPQLFLTAVNAGILQAILRDARALVHARSGRAYYFAPSATPVDDPLQLRLLGDLAAQAFVAEAAVLAAADAHDALERAGAPDRDLSHNAALLAAKAKVVIDAFALEAGGRVFDLGGASTTQRSVNLDRHWRNARTLASHNPAHLKAFAIGGFELNGTLLPDQGFF